MSDKKRSGRSSSPSKSSRRSKTRAYQDVTEEVKQVDPPIPSGFPSAKEFLENKEIIYARIEYRKDRYICPNTEINRNETHPVLIYNRSNYYVDQWRLGKLNPEDLVMNTEMGVNYAKPI